MSPHPLVLAATLAFAQMALPGADLSPREFYAYCIEMGVPKVKPRPLSEQAALLRDLGYDGTGCSLWLDGSLEANLKILDDAGLRLHMVWTTVNVNPANGAAFPPALPDAIRGLKGRPTTVSVLLAGLKPADPQGLETAVKALRELGDVAGDAGVRISIYNHINNWAEAIPFAIGVVRAANHPRVGFNFNLCHWLKVDGDKNYTPLLRENAAKLFCVTINGAEIGAANWADGLIQPLDKGDFDNRGLLAALDEIGYRGPVGLMCFAVPGDPRDHLARSMATWKSWHGK
ncbi:MAG TPA: TIM barrel protein [Verrucomicrobiae bacterium]|nr:TIM barrel protein [Verrucomicrobiae bacterium]